MANHEDAQRNPEPSESSAETPTYADELPNACPPADASAATGTFYATHRASPPDGLDFRTAASRDVFKRADECKRRGNSIMASIEDARQLCRAYPDVHVYVSAGALEAQHGMLLRDETKKYPSHHTLWRFYGVTMHDIFVKVV